MTDNAPYNAIATANRTPVLQVFLVSLALMLFEINLVRLYSIVIRNLGFFVLAVSLFGLGLGGLYAHIQRRPARQSTWMFTLPLLGSAAMVAAFLVLCLVPLRTTGEIAGHYSAVRLGILFLTASGPFFFGSVYISRVFAAWPQRANKLYFGDLLGASLGSLAAIFLLQVFGGVTMPFVVAGLAAFVAAFAAETRGKKAVLSLALAGYLILGSYNYATTALNVHPDGVKRNREPLFSMWNFSSRIEVAEDPGWRGWRPSVNYKGPKPDYLSITQDGHAPAFLLPFGGDFSKVEHLRWDITSMPYEVLDPERVLVIGAGGGRDILTAKYYGVPAVDAVELNPITANDVMRGAFAEISGHVYTMDGVRIFEDNGRTYVNGTTETYDLIYTSLADTLLGKAEGAFILSENHLYTTEALTSYLNRLTPKGVACILYSALREGQLLARFTGSAADALRASGIERPEEHIMAMMTPDPPGGVAEGVCLMFSKGKITPEMIARAQKSCERLGYTLAWPKIGPDNEWRRVMDHVLQPELRDAYMASSFFDQSPFHDDRPYIFYCIKPEDFLKALLTPWSSGEQLEVSLAGLPLLIDLFLVVFVCVMVMMVSPIVIFGRKALAERQAGQFTFLLLFFLLGVGFMMIEVSLLQQLFLFLGDPTLTFAVTLCFMLAFTGMGSLLSQRVPEGNLAKMLGPMAGIACAVLLVVTLGVKPLLDHFQSAGLYARLFVLVPVLAIIALPMGALMPSCIRLLGRRETSITSWAWGMNGVGSVLGTVAASIIALNLGITRVYWTGLACYAVVAVVATLRQKALDASKPLMERAT